jgi:myo-inositol-1(or 4)-monophosphatase
VLDPIDGTINFSRGSPLCAISLALLEGGLPVLALVDLPALGERYVAQRGAGAYRKRARLGVHEVEALSEAVIGLTDFAVGPEAQQENRVHLRLLRELAPASLRIRCHGCASLDLAWLAAGRLSATVMLSNRPWDVSAGVLIAQEAGAVPYDFDGSPHSAQSRFTIASTPALKPQLQPILARATG